MSWWNLSCDEALHFCGFKVAASWQPLLSRCETILVGELSVPSCWSWVGGGGG